MSNEAENRRHPRVNARWPLTLLRQHERIEGETRNISISGVLIQSDEPLRLNEFLRLSLEPPLIPPIWVSGEVVWADSERSSEKTENHLMGFSFGKISYVDRTLFRDLVSIASTQH
jgi:hypothetical protein